MAARARAALAQIERDAGPWDGAAAEAVNSDRQATIHLLRRYGRSRTGLMGARPPQWRPSDGLKPSGWKRTAWEDRLNFCLDVELALFGLRSPRHRHVLMQSFALDRNRVEVARELGVCTRTLSRIENAALDAMHAKCRALGVPV
jgi:DNA-directed RNA polymerase specialized sigma24 family protein